MSDIARAARSLPAQQQHPRRPSDVLPPSAHAALHLADERLLALRLRADERDGLALAPGARGAADAVDVLDDVGRELVLDDERDAGQEAARLQPLAP